MIQVQSIVLGATLLMAGLSTGQSRANHAALYQMFSAAKRHDSLAIQKSYRGLPRTPLNVSAHLIALYISDPSKYSNYYVHNFPTQSNTIMRVIYGEIGSVLRLTDTPFFAFDRLGNIAGTGNEAAIVKLITVHSNADGIIAEITAEQLIHVWDRHAREMLGALKLINPRERQELLRERYIWCDARQRGKKVIGASKNEDKWLISISSTQKRCPAN